MIIYHDVKIILNLGKNEINSVWKNIYSQYVGFFEIDIYYNTSLFAQWRIYKINFIWIKNEYLWLKRNTLIGIISDGRGWVAMKNIDSKLKALMAAYKVSFLS